MTSKTKKTKTVKNPGIVSEYLKTYTLDFIKTITNMMMPSKSWKPLDRGNSKLEGNIFIWNLIPVITCMMACKGCYDVRSLRFPNSRAKRLYNTWVLLHNPETLKSMIISQIIKSKGINFVRIHGGGDFINLEYVAFWGEIVAEVKKTRPEIEFYTYTKTKFEDEIKMCGITVNPSKIKGLGFNYNDLPVLEKFIEDHADDDANYMICPATKGNDVKCGKTCTACMTDEKTVLFVKH
jgi:hypothetical protein